MCTYIVEKNYRGVRYPVSANHGTKAVIGRATASQLDTSLGSAVIEFLSKMTIYGMLCDSDDLSVV